MKRIRIERSAAAGLLLGFGLSCATTFSARRASAESSEERVQARRHFDQGVILARKQAYDEALSEFQRAYQSSPHFSVLYNIGQALIALGRPTEAIAALTRYVEEGGASVDPQRRAEVDRAIDEQATKTGRIEIAIDLPGALVSVDDAPYGRAPLSVAVRVDPGAHRVLATRESGEQRTANIEVAANQLARVQLDFGGQATGAAIVSPAPTPPIPPLPAPTPLLGFRAPAPKPAIAHRSTQKTVAYVVEAVGVSLTVAAVAHFFWNRARYHDWQSRYDTYYHDPNAQNRAAANDLAHSVSAASAVTIGLTLSAGVALGTGAVLQLTSSDPVTGSGSARDHGPFLSVRGSF